MKFTIRDLLWLTVVVAMLLTAWLNYRRWISVEAENLKLQATNTELAERNARQKAILDYWPVTGSNWESAPPKLYSPTDVDVDDP